MASTFGSLNIALEPSGLDGSGMYQQGRLAVERRWLSIIDLSTDTNQLMVDSKPGLALAFSSCISNC
jgi:asparagine synthase (glutamine-hydrolysing)